MRNQEWSGYTLDQIRVHRIVNLTRIELERTRLEHMTEPYTKGTGGFFKVPIVSKMFGALDYLDYGFIAYKLIKRALPIFRKKKKA